MATKRTENNFVATTGNSHTVQLTGVQAGDLLTITIRERDGSAAPTGVSDDVNGAWTQRQRSSVLAAQVLIYERVNSGSGNPTITISWSGNRNVSGVASAFYSETGGSFAYNTGTTGTTSATTSHAVGAGITGQQGVVVAVGGHSANAGTITDGADTFTGFTMAATSNREYSRYKLLGSSLATTAPYTSASSVSSDQAMAAWTETPGGGGGKARPLFRQSARFFRRSF